MQAICHLSRRWHQQFCRSPSFINHRQCLQQWQVRTYASRKPNVVVQEWDQIEGDPSSRRPMGGPFDEHIAATREHIKKLEKELAVLRKGPFTREGEFMQSLPEQEREKLLAAIEAEGLEDDDFSSLSFDDILEEQPADRPLAVTMRIPSKHRAYVRKFNEALKTSDVKSKKKLWIWYLRCQQKVPGFANFIPEDVWDHLWQTQLDMNSPKTHLVMLGKDMQAAGVDLDDHLPDYIEALHETGQTTTALEIWEKEQKPARVGVQLYAAVGRPSKAEEIALTHLTSQTILPVIQAWSESKKPDSSIKLWSFYRRITPTTDLLGQITSVLLKAGRKDMALAVFRDMMDRDQTLPEKNIKDINEFGLTALLALPQKFKNKFFFGAWIKWLLGEGKVEDATLVVELMQEYGIKPDARHLNGIIGAWLRHGTVFSRTKAEQIAWGMIQERIRQVEQRGRTLLRDEAELLEEHELSSMRLPRFLQRNIPSATIETFSLLLQQQTRQADISKSEQLTNIMSGPAQIKPNSFILNHWLYLSLRSSDLDKLWARYSAVKDSIKPDLDSFTCLWDGERRSLTLSTPSAYPTPRQLYRETLTWFYALPTAKQDETREQFSPDLYEQIIRCFCLHSDLPCTFLALQHMRETFNMLPNKSIVEMIVMQVARMMPGSDGTPAAQPRRIARRRSDVAYRTSLSNFAELMDQILTSNVTQAEIDGVEIGDYDDPQNGIMQAIRLESLRTFLCLVMLRRAKEADNPSNDIVVAGQAMGVKVESWRAKKWLDEAVKTYEEAP